MEPAIDIQLPAHIRPVIEAIFDLFAADDGGLPEICLHGLSGHEVEEIYASIRRITAFLVGRPVFRHIFEHVEKPLDSVPNAAALVVRGEAEPFHFLCRGIKVCGVQLPDLGVFVFANAVAFDYERGPLWQIPQIVALLHLLRDLIAQLERPFITFDADNGRDENDRFIRNMLLFFEMADRPVNL